MPNNGTVYLLHFDRPFHHAKHYLGFVNGEGIETRLARHARGDGANLTKHVVAAGIGFQVVRTWENVDRNFERTLKNQHNGPRLCPVCSKHT